MANVYKNLDIVSGQGGSERVTIASNVGQGSDQPCKKVILQASHADVRVKIGSACTATTGIQVPYVAQDSGTPANNVYNNLELDIKNTNQLYFYGGTDTATVDILYRM